MHISFSEKRVDAWQSCHVVNNSWLPIFIRARVFSLIRTSLFIFKFGFSFNFTLARFYVGLRVFRLWLKDVTRESTLQGLHTNTVQSGLKWGLTWFLFREVYFFYRVFWGFFHFRTAPITNSSRLWPLIGVESIPVFQVPLLNTIILLIRGVTATLAHLETLKGEKSIWIFITALLGLYFLALQGTEYYNSSFRISSRLYGRVFFFGTGFHGLHVTLGLSILLVITYRIHYGIIRRHHHFRLEFSLWYWHFVDVVWLFLFFFMYAWGR